MLRKLLTISHKGKAMKLLTVALSTFFILFSMSAHAEFYSGSKLFGFLDKDMRGIADYDVGVETGYIVGVFDTLSTVMVCAPHRITIIQVKHVVYNYMQKHPESWDESADMSVTAALIQVWPCKKK